MAQEFQTLVPSSVASLAWTHVVRSFQPRILTFSSAGERTRSMVNPQPRSVPRLLSHAKCLEDDVQDVVGAGGAGDEVEGPQCVVEVEQEHFVRQPLDGGLAGLGQALE